MDRPGFAAFKAQAIQSAVGRVDMVGLSLCTGLLCPLNMQRVHHATDFVG